MARKKLCTAILAVALAVVPAVAMAQDSSVAKGSLSRTGTGVATDQVAEAMGLAEGDTIVILGVLFVVAGGVLVAVALGGGDGGTGTSTSTSTATGT